MSDYNYNNILVENIVLFSVAYCSAHAHSQEYRIPHMYMYSNDSVDVTHNNNL